MDPECADDDCGQPDVMLGLFAVGAVLGFLLTPCRGMAIALARAWTDDDAMAWLRASWRH